MTLSRHTPVLGRGHSISIMWKLKGKKPYLHSCIYLQNIFYILITVRWILRLLVGLWYDSGIKIKKRWLHHQILYKPFFFFIQFHLISNALIYMANDFMIMTALLHSSKLENFTNKNTIQVTLSVSKHMFDAEFQSLL